MSEPFVLVADPSTDIERALRPELAAAGLTLVSARDGQAAHTELAKRGAPLVLVTDLSLPKRDGFALLRALRRTDPKRTTRAIAFSAFPKLREAAEAMNAELGPLVVLDCDPLATARAVRDAIASRATPVPTRVGAPRPAYDLAAEREKMRTAVVREMRVMDDEPPEDELQAIIAEVARSFDVPIALLTILFDDKQWFKAHHGLSGQLLANRGSPRDWAFCQHVVEGHRPLVVTDARQHPVFDRNPLVLDGTITGYAGAPLETKDGQVLGSLCIIDKEPLDLDADGIVRLVQVARHVAGELEVRALKARAASTPTALAAPGLGAFETVLGALDVGIILLRADRRAVYANAATEAMFGVTPDSLVGKTRNEILVLVGKCFADADQQLERLRVPAEGPFVLRETVELVRPKPRVVRWVGCPVILPDGVGQIMSFTDITAEHALARTEEKLARTDTLTGALNRRGGVEVLERETARSDRFSTPLSLAIVDVDNLKRLNDTLGHEMGDLAIVCVVDAVRRAVRTIDAVVRWGGDEFIVVLPGTNREGALAFGERLRNAVMREVSAAFAETVLAHGQAAAVGLTLSIGVAQYTAGEVFEETIARADTHLYEAKAAGRDAVRG